jgi:hypothetical protein
MRVEDGKSARQQAKSTRGRILAEPSERVNENAAL